MRPTTLSREHQVGTMELSPRGKRCPDVELVPVGGGDPFALYSFLQEIWPEPYKRDAAFASRVDSESGEIFYITRDTEVVGITGVFSDDIASTEDLFLRWTGVAPGLRQSGLGRAAIRQLAQLCLARYPERKRLIELVPDNAYGHTVAKPFFEKLGFYPCEITVPCAEDADWAVIAYAAELKRLRYL